MKAWLKKEGALALADVPDPTPLSNELLVRVRAFSLNRGELRSVVHARDGQIPGWDIAGTVLREASSGSGPTAGTRVAALLNGGGWAELAAVPLHRAAVIPQGVPDYVAATLPIAVLTVLRAFGVGGTLLTKRVLVTGASGGVGQFAIQLAAISGAYVCAITSRATLHNELKGLGAHEVVANIDQADSDFDLILESVGGSSLATAVNLLAPAGVVVSIGNSSEADTIFNARSLYSKGAAKIYGLLVFEELENRRVSMVDLESVMTLISKGLIRAPITLRRDWEALPETITALDQREYTGKAVLEIR